ncbi:MAG: PD-(D/E)XK nuclease family protein, partial [Bacteroidales bacterium]|nr:PD-(D/E)XK nuclease family protein [Bacteroidales bacterium]
PAKFYFSKDEGLKEVTQVAEDLDAGMLVDIYHSTMQALYMGEGAMDPSYDLGDRDKNAAFPGALKTVTKEYISSWLKRGEDIKNRIRSLIMKQLRSLEVVGRNLVLENILLQYVLKTLERDKELMEKLGVDSFRIVGLEKKYTGEIDGFKFVGYVDRMDSFLPGELRIVDYKTGKVEAREININDDSAVPTAEKLFGDKNADRPKIAFQIFLYDILVRKDPATRGFAFVNSIYQPAALFKEGVRNVPMCDKFNEEVMERLHKVLAELVDTSVPWRRTDDENTCSWCDLKMICGR